MQSDNIQKLQLLGLNAEEISALLPSAPRYSAGQIFRFLQSGYDFDAMTSLSKAMRAYLKDNFIANPVSIIETFKGKSGTEKYLFKLPDNEVIEGVYMPHDYGDTLCVSTQIGCRTNCSFCASGMDGLKRNLSAGEILGQVIAVNALKGGNIEKRAVTNIVLMGSGEPFDNYDNVLKFLDLVSKPQGINVSERNISLSTSGLCDKIRQFADSGHKVTLSISLHAPFDELRSTLMPVNKRYNVAEVVSAAKYYFEKTGRRVIFEYTLIKGENDTDECIAELARLTRGFPTHVNVIKLNAVKERNHKSPTDAAAAEFVKKLEAAGVSATVRRSLGGDIDGACGQLRRRYLSLDKIGGDNV